MIRPAVIQPAEPPARLAAPPDGDTRDGDTGEGDTGDGGTRAGDAITDACEAEAVVAGAVAVFSAGRECGAGDASTTGSPGMTLLTRDAGAMVRMRRALRPGVSLAILRAVTAGSKCGALM